ncbi:MAG: hypothetical protein ACM3RR_00060 [Bacillota bacterium]
MKETFRAKISKHKNRITIPKATVDYLKLEPGDFVKVTIETEAPEKK